MLKCNVNYKMIDNGLFNISDLMTEAKISRKTANKLFHNENITSIKLETLMKVCDALNCKLSDLVEYVPDHI